MTGEMYRHKVGIGSMGIISHEEPEKGYGLLKEAGFDCVDFNFDAYLNINNVLAGNINDCFEKHIEESWKDFEPHVNAAKKYGLTFEQMHAPFPVLIRGRHDLSERMTCITKNCIELCKRMGGKYLVVHPVSLAYECSKQEEHDFNMGLYEELIDTAKQSGVKICLENMFVEKNFHMMEGVCSDFKETADMIDELNAVAGEELFGFCFDVGHANLLGKNLYQSLVTLGNRVKILHIHDNDGLSDLHSIPYTFGRSWSGISTDWEGFIRGLAAVRYEGVINFETYRVMRNFPAELHKEVLSLIAATGRYFSMRIMEESVIS